MLLALAVLICSQCGSTSPCLCEVWHAVVMNSFTVMLTESLQVIIQGCEVQSVVMVFAEKAFLNQTLKEIKKIRANQHHNKKKIATIGKECNHQSNADAKDPAIRNKL